jgi:hypothetical protein
MNEAVDGFENRDYFKAIDLFEKAKDSAQDFA